MDYTFAIKELLCRCRSNPFLASNGCNVMDPLLIPLPTVETGIQSLYILKMWQFDYAFRLHHGMDDLRSPFRFVLAIKTSQRSQCHVDYYKHDIIALIEDSEKRSERVYGVRLEIFSHDTSLLSFVVPITQIFFFDQFGSDALAVWFSYQWFSFLRNLNFGFHIHVGKSLGRLHLNGYRYEELDNSYGKNNPSGYAPGIILHIIYPQGGFMQIFLSPR
ncbi:hypothetical protein T12_1037, partial [Trichinella patagoniensis]